MDPVSLTLVVRIVKPVPGRLSVRTTHARPFPRDRQYPRARLVASRRLKTTGPATQFGLAWIPAGVGHRGACMSTPVRHQASSFRRRNAPARYRRISWWQQRRETTADRYTIPSTRRRMSTAGPLHTAIRPAPPIDSARRIGSAAPQRSASAVDSVLPSPRSGRPDERSATKPPASFCERGRRAVPEPPHRSAIRTGHEPRYRRRLRAQCEMLKRASFEVVTVGTPGRPGSWAGGGLGGSTRTAKNKSPKTQTRWGG